jgi:hypothetical protein
MEKIASPLRVEYYSTSNKQSIIDLLSRYTLKITEVTSDAIPGSFWGDSEAGIIANEIFVRQDTPVHSLMHEACHFICMDQTRRSKLDTNAEGDYDEENAVCYLQIYLSDFISDYSSLKMMNDMDIWGYTFRLGSARKWYENDADDALAWLKKERIFNQKSHTTWALRGL